MDSPASASPGDEGTPDDGEPRDDQPRDDRPRDELPSLRPASRRIPGDIGWRLDGGGGTVYEAGGLLRMVSVVPFLVLGAVAVIALVGWLLFFVLGVGQQQSVWGWASGQTRPEVLRQVGLVLALGLGCLSVLVLAMWATLYGFRLDARRWFWRLWEALALAGVAGLVVLEALAGPRRAAGLHVTDIVFLVAGLAATIVLCRLREVRAPVARRDGAEDAG